MRIFPQPGKAFLHLVEKESVSDTNATTTTRLPALQQVLGQLDAFKRKFYLNLLVRGALVAGGLLLTLFLVLNLLEYFLYLPTWVRGGLLFGFLGLVVYTFLHWIWKPLGGPHQPAPLTFRRAGGPARG